MENEHIAALRMRNQRLWGHRYGRAEDVVRSMAALQAQEFSIAKWSVAQRAHGVVESDLDRAFSEGRILRTHVLRPTWHFVSRDDIAWILRLSAPRVHQLSAHYYRKLELDGAVFGRAEKVMAAALSGGVHLTRAQMSVELQAGGLPADGMRLSYLMMHAELEGIVCSGAPKGKKQTYALLEERAPQTKAVDRDAALAHLARRYFETRGPATVRDFARWSSFTITDCRRAVKTIEQDLQRQVVGDRTYWFSTGEPPPPSPPRVDLVQIYDEYVMSYSESRDVLACPDILVSENHGLLHGVLLAGRVVGRWKLSRASTSAAVLIRLYGELEPMHKAALARAVDRFGRFLGTPVTLRVV